MTDDHTTTLNSGKIMISTRTVLICCLVSSVLWHVILLLAVHSGKGFLSNLALVWVFLFFLLPTINLGCFLAFSLPMKKRRTLKALDWAFMLLTISPLVTFGIFWAVNS